MIGIKYIGETFVNGNITIFLLIGMSTFIYAYYKSGNLINSIGVAIVVMGFMTVLIGVCNWLSKR